MTMRTAATILTAVMLMTGSLSAAAQVKDGRGRALGIGRPAGGAITDWNGGRIGTGRAEVCRLFGAGEARRPCIFYPRNGDGSFAIDVEGRAYYADLIERDRVTIAYDNGARLVPKGVFIRSRTDAACWVGPQREQFCAW